jgi:hypothetical protein
MILADGDLRHPSVEGIGNVPSACEGAGVTDRSLYVDFVTGINAAYRLRLRRRFHTLGVCARAIRPAPARFLRCPYRHRHDKK